MSVLNIFEGLFKREKEELVATYKNCGNWFLEIDKKYTKDTPTPFDFADNLANIKRQIESSQISDAEQKKLNIILQLMGTWNEYSEQNKQNLKRIISYCNDKQKEYGLTRHTKTIGIAAAKGLLAFVLYFAAFSFVLSCIGMSVSYFWNGAIIKELDFWSEWLGQILKIFIIIASLLAFAAIHRTKNRVAIEDYWQS